MLTSTFSYICSTCSALGNLSLWLLKSNLGGHPWLFLSLLPTNLSAHFVKSTFKMPWEFSHFLSCPCYLPGLSHHHTSLSYYKLPSNQSPKMYVWWSRHSTVQNPLVASHVIQSKNLCPHLESLGPACPDPATPSPSFCPDLLSNLSSLRLSLMEPHWPCPSSSRLGTLLALFLALTAPSLCNALSQIVTLLLPSLPSGLCSYVSFSTKFSWAHYLKCQAHSSIPFPILTLLVFALTLPILSYMIYFTYLVIVYPPIY